MKSLLFAVMGLNILFYLTSNLDHRDTKPLPLKDDDVPQLLNLVNLEDLRSPTNSEPKKGETKTSSQPVSAEKKTAFEKSKPKDDITEKKSPEIVATASPAALASTTGSAPWRVASTQECVSLGPFSDLKEARDLNGQLVDKSVPTQLRKVREQQKFHIYLRQEARSESSESLVRRLKAKGLVDHRLITRTKEQYVISLGWYEHEDAASFRLKQITDLGFRPRLELHGSKGEQFWLDYLVPRGKKLPTDIDTLIVRSREENFIKSVACNSAQATRP